MLDELSVHDREFTQPALAGPAEVEAFERRAGVTLPSSYREYLTTVGNGGPGPFGGLFALGFTKDPSTGDPEPLPDELCARIREPFVGSMDREEPEEDWDPGVIPLAWCGDTMWAWLVVTGEERGQVWETEGGAWFPAPTPLQRQVTLIEWYAAWLHDLRAQRTSV